MKLSQQIEDILKGSFRAAGMLMKGIERSDPDARDVLKRLLRHTGNAHIIGITGFPGAGKSTLIDRLITSFRTTSLTVGVIAVDPTSPMTGGALLGDRIRMQRHSTDRGVFIRSAAARGHPGGLSRVVWDFAAILDAMGMKVILIETAGVGQVELDIRRWVHTNIVVMTPEYGDGIQAMKAGLIETAHILVFNKSDTYKTAPIIAQLISTADLYPNTWKPPIIKTSALLNKGIDDLRTQIENHKQLIRQTPASDLLRISEQQFFDIFKDTLFQAAKDRLLHDHRFQNLLLRLANRETDPISASEEALTFVLKQQNES